MVNSRQSKAPLALIFDMDGVLVDSEPLHKRAKELAFQEVGIVLPESVYDCYKGRPDAAMFPEVYGSRGGSAEQIAALLRRKRQIFEGIEHELQVVPGAVEFVHWAKSQYRLGLATSATARNREVALALLGIGDCIESIVDSGRSQRPKPDPEVFQIVMRELNLSASQCWIIEDSMSGLRAAKAAECVAVGITTAFERSVLSEAGADMVVDSFAELRERLESL
jgi:HAD superfamily hydrolase (TIGR01509 family)